MEEQIALAIGEALLEEFASMRPALPRRVLRTAARHGQGASGAQYQNRRCGAGTGFICSDRPYWC